MQVAASFRNWLHTNHKLTVQDEEFIEHEEEYVKAYKRYRVNFYERMAGEYEDYNTLSFRIGALFGGGIMAIAWALYSIIAPIWEGLQTW